MINDKPSIYLFKPLGVWLIGLSLALFAFSSHAAVEKGRTPERVTLQLKWTHAFQFAGYYAALEKGYYREAGLDVNIVEATPGVDPIKNVLAGRAQYGVGTSSLLLERKAGKPVVALAVIFQHSPYVLIARQDSATQGIHDLIGKRIMLEPQSDELLAYLKAEGIPLERIIRVEHSYDVRDLIDGRIDAIAGYVINQPYDLDRAHFQYQIYTPRSAGIDFYGDNLFTTERELLKHPARVRAFRAASLRGWQYAMEHPAEIVDLILAQYSQRQTRDYFLFEARTMLPLLRPELIEIGYMNPGRWRHIADTYANIGMMQPDFDLKGFLYDPNPPPPDLGWLYALMGVAALVIAAVSALALFIYRMNRRLRREIAERRQAEETLRDSEARFRSYFQLPLHGIAITSPEKGWLQVNDQLCSILGYTREEIARRTWSEMTYPEDLAADVVQFERVLAGQLDQYKMEKRFIRKDGVIVWTTVSAGCVRKPDRTVDYMVCVMDDITERKWAESELQKMQKLQSIGTLAGGIAHDFNNILLGLFGNIALAKMDLAKDHPGYELLEEAEKSMSRAVRLTKQLLTFAKGGEPVKEAVNLGPLAEEIARFDLSGSNVRLVYRSVDNLWAAEVDRGQIQQVISNLTINARQAMPDGGCLHITLENTVVPAATMIGLVPGRYVKISMRDEGPGIEHKYITRIFDPYFTTKQAGNGLGLATAYSIIQKHGGHIDVASELGKGATFTLYVPAAQAPQRPETKEPSRERPPTDRPARILVMDDEEPVRHLVERMLKRCGYNAATSPDGANTVVMYQQAKELGTPFDAVIMDLTIPGGKGGTEAIQDLLAIDPQARVIVSSGYADDPVMANYADYGFKGIVAKPYTPDELRKVLGQVLSGP